MSATETPVNNGVNVEALLGAREALGAAPEAAAFTWRASCEWLNGTHSSTSVEDFFGLGGEQAHRVKSSFDVDHPEIFASEDNGPTPVEYILVGLAGCLTAGIAAVAQNRNIQLHSVKSTIEGDMDVQGALGLSDDHRNGFDRIRVSFRVAGNAPEEKLREVVERAQQRSAVFDMVTNGVPVSVDVTTG